MMRLGFVLILLLSLFGEHVCFACSQKDGERGEEASVPKTGVASVVVSGEEFDRLLEDDLRDPDPFTGEVFCQELEEATHATIEEWLEPEFWNTFHEFLPQTGAWVEFFPPPTDPRARKIFEFLIKGEVENFQVEDLLEVLGFQLSKGDIAFWDIASRANLEHWGLTPTALLSEVIDTLEKQNLDESLEPFTPILLTATTEQELAFWCNSQLWKRWATHLPQPGTWVQVFSQLSPPVDLMLFKFLVDEKIFTSERWDLINIIWQGLAARDWRFWISAYASPESSLPMSHQLLLDEFKDKLLTLYRRTTIDRYDIVFLISHLPAHLIRANNDSLDPIWSALGRTSHKSDVPPLEFIPDISSFSLIDDPKKKELLMEIFWSWNGGDLRQFLTVNDIVEDMVAAIVDTFFEHPFPHPAKVSIFPQRLCYYSKMLRKRLNGWGRAQAIFHPMLFEACYLRRAEFTIRDFSTSIRKINRFISPLMGPIWKTSLLLRDGHCFKNPENPHNFAPHFLYDSYSLSESQEVEVLLKMMPVEALQDWKNPGAWKFLIGMDNAHLFVTSLMFTTCRERDIHFWKEFLRVLRGALSSPDQNPQLVCKVGTLFSEELKLLPLTSLWERVFAPDVWTDVSLFVRHNPLPAVRALSLMTQSPELKRDLHHLTSDSNITFECAFFYPELLKQADLENEKRNIVQRFALGANEYLRLILDASYVGNEKQKKILALQDVLSFYPDEITAHVAFVKGLVKEEPSLFKDIILSTPLGEFLRTIIDRPNLVGSESQQTDTIRARLQEQVLTLPEIEAVICAFDEERAFLFWLQRNLWENLIANWEFRGHNLRNVLLRLSAVNMSKLVEFIIDQRLDALWEWDIVLDFMTRGLETYLQAPYSPDESHMYEHAVRQISLALRERDPRTVQLDALHQRFVEFVTQHISDGHFGKISLLLRNPAVTNVLQLNQSLKIEAVCQGIRLRMQQDSFSADVRNRYFWSLLHSTLEFGPSLEAARWEMYSRLTTDFIKLRGTQGSVLKDWLQDMWNRFFPHQSQRTGFGINILCDAPFEPTTLYYFLRNATTIEIAEALLEPSLWPSQSVDGTAVTLGMASLVNKLQPSQVKDCVVRLAQKVSDWSRFSFATVWMHQLNFEQEPTFPRLKILLEPDVLELTQDRFPPLVDFRHAISQRYTERFQYIFDSKRWPSINRGVLNKAVWEGYDYALEVLNQPIRLLFAQILPRDEQERDPKARDRSLAAASLGNQIHQFATRTQKKVWEFLLQSIPWEKVLEEENVKEEIEYEMDITYHKKAELYEKGNKSQKLNQILEEHKLLQKVFRKIWEESENENALEDRQILSIVWSWLQAFLADYAPKKRQKVIQLWINQFLEESIKSYRTAQPHRFAESCLKGVSERAFTALRGLGCPEIDAIYEQPEGRFLMNAFVDHFLKEETFSHPETRHVQLQEIWRTNPGRWKEELEQEADVRSWIVQYLHHTAEGYAVLGDYQSVLEDLATHQESNLGILLDELKRYQLCYAIVSAVPAAQQRGAVQAEEWIEIYLDQQVGEGHISPAHKALAVAKLRAQKNLNKVDTSFLQTLHFVHRCWMERQGEQQRKREAWIENLQRAVDQTADSSSQAGPSGTHHLPPE